VLPQAVCPLGHVVVVGGVGVQLPTVPQIMPDGQSPDFWHTTVTLFPQLEARAMKSAQAKPNATTM
jgi:hypothetical protein